MAEHFEEKYNELNKKYSNIIKCYSGFSHDILGKYFSIFRPKYTENHWKELREIFDEAYELTDKAPISLWKKCLHLSIEAKEKIRDSKNAKEEELKIMLPKKSFLLPKGR